MSIQALILVPDPFFNEPGYEKNRGTPEGDRQSRQYNEVIREATVKFAMIAHLKTPAPELADPIRMHFRMRKVMPTPSPRHAHRRICGRAVASPPSTRSTPARVSARVLAGDHSRAGEGLGGGQAQLGAPRVSHERPRR